MDWQMLGAIAESLGAVGVIISLLYLAAQVRSGTRATRRSNAHEYKAGWRAFFTLLASTQEVASLWQRGMVNPESLSTAESMHFSTLLLQATSLWEESYYAAQDEDVEMWATYSDTMARPELVGLPGFRKWFAERGHWSTPEFRELLEAEIQEGSESLASFYATAMTEGNES